ncbi:hypothetical protein ABE10_00860 [Bacillus toyonensis]|nr:hypothetical protein [Bacillus toyonensis]
MPWKDADGVRKAPEQAHRAMHGLGELARICPDGHGQIRPADVSDEQRVPGEHGAGLTSPGLVDEKTDGFPGMPWRLKDLDLQIAQTQPVAMCEPADRIVRLGLCAVADPRAGGLGDLQVPGEEVRVEVRVHHTDDSQVGFVCVVEVVRDVPSGIDEQSLTRPLVAEQV